MTRRCRMLVVLGILGTALGILGRQQGLSLLSLSVLVWIFFSWCEFSIRSGQLWSSLRSHRSLNSRSDDKVTLWSQRPLSVRVVLAVAPPRWCFLDVEDLLPENLALIDGESTMTAAGGNGPLELEYHCRPLAAGRVRFAGLHVTVRDLHGFFRAERVVSEGAVSERGNAEFRVLPSFAVVGDVHPTIKRINSLPQHGIHHLQRAGFGSELLELREYQPGDPPKAIAWKVSARREQLMTRQYESEVPVRLTLILDGTDCIRLGGYGMRMIDQMNFVAASIAKSAVSVGDSIGAVVVETDAHLNRRMAPASGDRAFYRLLQLLADFSLDRAPDQSGLTSELFWICHAQCRRCYPDLFDDRLHKFSLGFWAIRPRRRRNLLARHQLAQVLGALYHLSIREVARLIRDDNAMAQCARRFLSDSGWAWLPPLVPEHGLLDPQPEKRRADLASAINRCVAAAHDNEVFVVFTDLIDPQLRVRASELEALVPSIKVALARHHRVVVICSTPTGQRPGSTPPLVPGAAVPDLFRQADQIRLTSAAQQVRRRLRGVGAASAFAGGTDVIGLVMAEAEMAGSGRFSPRIQAR